MWLGSVVFFVMSGAVMLCFVMFRFVVLCFVVFSFVVFADSGLSSVDRMTVIGGVPQV